MEFGDGGVGNGGSRCFAYGLDSRVRSRVRSLITYHDDGWIMLVFGFKARIHRLDKCRCVFEAREGDRKVETRAKGRCKMTTTDDASGREKQRGQLLRQTRETNHATTPNQITCPPLPPANSILSRYSRLSERGYKSHASHHPKCPNYSPQ